MITLTENAIRKIEEFRASEPALLGKYFRLSLKPAGCSGYEYDLAFDEKKTDDIELAPNGIAVVLDPQSAKYLKSSTVDYKDELTGAGFKIANPNVKSTCGCGESNKFE